MGRLRQSAEEDCVLFYDAEMSAIHRLHQHGRCNVCSGCYYCCVCVGPINPVELEVSVLILSRVHNSCMEECV